MSAPSERITSAPVRERVTWVRWDKRRLRNVTSHPYRWHVTEPDGYVRGFDSRGEADAWIAEYNAEVDYVEGTP